MKNIERLKERLKNGETVLGTWCILPSAATLNVIAATGLDFVIIDMEHGPHSIQTTEDMLRAAEVEGCAPLVRVSMLDESMILRALDIGASGVVIPHIESTVNARKAVTFSKYHPVGKRGFSPFTRAGGYSPALVTEHGRTQNERTIVVLMLEGVDGVRNLDAILRMPLVRKSVDVIYIGAYDLSQALGYPGQVDHPRVRAHLKECVEKIRASGIAPGGYVAKNRADMEWMSRMGMQFITLLPDTTVLFNAYAGLSREFNEIRKSHTGRRS